MVWFILPNLVCFPGGRAMELGFLLTARKRERSKFPLSAWLCAPYGASKSPMSPHLSPQGPCEVKSIRPLMQMKQPALRETSSLAPSHTP